MKAIALIAALILPHDAVARDRCERLETNHVYDQCGQLNFTQLIAWEPSGRVFFWRMQKGQICVTRDWACGGYVARWNDDGVHREIRARSHEETWEQVDVEILDRELLPATQRRELK